MSRYRSRWGGILLTLMCVPTFAAAGQPARAPVLVLGGGLGAGSVSKLEGRRVQELGANLVGRVGVGVSSRVRVVLEGELHRLEDGLPSPGEVVVPSPVFRTRIFLVGTQIFLHRGWFVRPGVGVGDHDFAVYSACDLAGAVCERAAVSSELGLAAGLAVGYEAHLSSHVGLTLETAGRISGGEDSSSSRRLLGVQGLVNFFW